MGLVVPLPQRVGVQLPAVPAGEGRSLPAQAFIVCVVDPLRGKHIHLDRGRDARETQEAGLSAHSPLMAPSAFKLS